MTGRAATTSMDGIPISQADIARIEAEERLHAQRQRQAAVVVAAAAHDVEDARMLLDILGLDRDIVLAARSARKERSARPAARRRSRAA